MTDFTIITQVLTVAGSLATFCAALKGVYMSFGNRRLGEENKAAIQEIHVMINDRVTQLLETTRRLAEMSVDKARLEGHADAMQQKLAAESSRPEPSVPFSKT